MKDFIKKTLLEYQSEYKMKKWKGVAIYPKILEDKKLSDFTDKEKEHLTRVGFRWYVYFQFRDPNTHEFKRHNAATLGINRNYKNFDERYKAVNLLKKAVKEGLKKGYSPHTVSATNKQEVMTIAQALDYALEAKKTVIGVNTFANYQSRINALKDYLEKKGILKNSIDTLNHQHIREHLQDMAKRTSISNRNASLSVIRSIFLELYQSDIIKENHIDKITPERVVKKKRPYKIYTLDQANEIIENLKEYHPTLGLFIKFIMYNFLRPIEIVRLKVENIDLEGKTLEVLTKQGRPKKKRIPDEIINDLIPHNLPDKKGFLFAMDKIGEEWESIEASRIYYYASRFDIFKKTLGYETGDGYTLYSFRHTFITIGYKNLRKRLSKDNALDELMKYTGHETRSSLAKYIHHNDVELVDEYKGIVK